MSTRIQKFCGLSGSEKLLLASSLALLPSVGLWVRVGGVRAIAPHKPRGAKAVSVESVRRTAEVINMAASCVSATCLTRSLLLTRLLHARGIDSQLRIGVRRREGVFEAHAWVEYQGVPVNDVPERVDQYSAFEEPLALGLYRFR